MADFVIGLLNLIIKALGAVLSLLVSVLPNSPFQAINNSIVEKYLGNLAWIIPFDAILSSMQIWLSAIAIYYVYQTVLRWIKVIE